MKVNSVLLAGMVLFTAAGAQAQNAPVVADSSFETPRTGNYTYNPTATGLTFSGNSGVVTNGSAFGFANAVDGTQVAFMQAGPGAVNGSISQLVSGLNVGQNYVLNFYAVNRGDPNYLPETMNVSFGGVLLGSYVAPSTAFTLASFNFVAQAASANLTFSATSGLNAAAGHEYDIALDKVSVVAGAVPEPAAWAMMILGMGAIGFAMRRQKITTRFSYAA